MILDISNVMIIRYPAAQVDEEDAGDSTGEIPWMDDDVDEDIQQTATEIGTESDDSSFHGSGVRSIRIDALALIAECTLCLAMLKPLGRASTPSSSTVLLAPA